ncbi:MAG: glyoxalase [Erythrobacter sp.]|nr:glyoxalase [Erythrobacter sp.]
MSSNGAKTKGIDHVGLTVSSLTQSLDFFVNALGFTEIGGKPDYPAAYISDGTATLTLWQTSDPSDYTQFDRRRNIGLHHLALVVTSSKELDDLFEKVGAWKGVKVEFGPEYSGSGPKRHFMISEPGGNRIEFSWDPRKS